MQRGEALRKKKAAEQRGRRAEFIASAMLILKGYAILARRFKTPNGEIDLIAKRGRLIALVEVKARNTHQEAIEAVHYHARRRIERAGHLFLAKNTRWANCAIRYDIISVVNNRPRHLKDAWREGD